MSEEPIEDNIKKGSCDGRTLMFLLKNQRTATDKANFLDDTIKSCGKKLYGAKKQRGGNGKEPKQKRAMSWYNACTKTNSNGKFGIPEKCKKENITDDDKKKYQQIANELNAQNGI